MWLALRGGRLIDASQKTDKEADLLVVDGRVEAVGDIDQNGLDPSQGIVYDLSLIHI